MLVDGPKCFTSSTAWSAGLSGIHTGFARRSVRMLDDAGDVLEVRLIVMDQPATVITADIDPLRSEGAAYAQRLASAGVTVDYRNYSGVTHEFFGMGAVVDQAKQAVDQAARGLRQAFGN